MSVISVIRGWECDCCGINRNTPSEVWRDCICELREKDENFYQEMEELVPVINDIYWKSFWSR